MDRANETPEACPSRGPRIGSEGQPVCCYPSGHYGPHHSDPETGFDVGWHNNWMPGGDRPAPVQPPAPDPSSDLTRSGDVSKIGAEPDTSPAPDPDETRPLADDGKPGCPVIVWDGPYSTRCAAGAAVGRCAHHGVFATPVPPPASDPDEACDCYPGGFTPDTYEGPQEHCPVHGGPGPTRALPAMTGGTDEAEGLARVVQLLIEGDGNTRYYDLAGSGQRPAREIVNAVLASDWLRERDLARDARTRADALQEAAEDLLIHSTMTAAQNVLAWESASRVVQAMADGAPRIQPRNRADQAGGAS